MIKWGMAIEGKGEGLRIQSKASELAHGSEWKTKVEIRAKQATSEVFRASSPAAMDSGAERLVKVCTEKRFTNAEELVLYVEKNPGDRKAREQEALLAQSLTMALMSEDEATVKAVEGGNVGAIEHCLPDKLKIMARGVRDVLTPIEIGGYLDRLEAQMDMEMVKELGDTKREVELVGATIKELQAWSVEHRLAKDSPERGALLRVLHALNDRKYDLAQGDVKEAMVVNGRERTPKRPPELVPPRFNKGGDEEEPGRWEERSWDMTYERFVELERKQVDPRWFAARPPDWYSRMEPEERAQIDVRIKLLETAASKREVRNKLPVEKLRGGVVPELDGKEFNLLWEEMPGFKEAMGFLVRDICEPFIDSDGRIFLRLKNNNGVMDPDVLKWLEDFDTLRDYVAKQIAAKRMGVVDVSGVGEIETRDMEAVSAMWNFLFVGDSIEAWDYFRQLKPTWICSDKLRTAYHLRSKALGKWRVYKPTGIKPESEGEEEPFVSTSMAVWVLDRLKFEQGFADRILRGDLQEILPDTLAVSMIETQKVKLENGDETTMALALLRNQEDQVRLDKNDRNIMQVHNDQVEGADFLSAAFKGSQPLDVNKNGGEWLGEYIQKTGLIRQVPTIPKTDGTFTTLPCVDRPMFIWSILLNSMGFNSYDVSPLLPEKKLGATPNNYDLKVRDLIDDMTLRSTVNKTEARRLLGAIGFIGYKKLRMRNDANRFSRMKTI